MIWKLQRKTCNFCKVEKSILEFYKSKSGWVFSRCGQCSRDKAKAYHKKNIERFKSSHRGNNNPHIDLGLNILLSITRGKAQLDQRMIAAFCQCTGQNISSIENKAMKKLMKRHKETLIQLRESL